eukprot:3172327-Prymnesium_polylepis.3
MAPSDPSLPQLKFKPLACAPSSSLGRARPGSSSSAGMKEARAAQVLGCRLAASRLPAQPVHHPLLCHQS